MLEKGGGLKEPRVGFMSAGRQDGVATPTLRHAPGDIRTDISKKYSIFGF